MIHLIIFIIHTIWWQPSNAIPLIFAHYMPWFQTTPEIVHWPFNSGTYYEPIIGYYSSDDITTIEWQIDLMEATGINGIIIDWYGVQEVNDYPFIKRATEIIWNEIKTNHPNFKLAILYDLNSVNTDSQKLSESLTYLNNNYFNHDQYLKDNENNPILLLWPSFASDATIQTPSGLNSVLSSVGLSDLNVYIEYKNPAFSWGTTNTYTNLGIFNWVYPYFKSTDQAIVIDEVKADILDLYNTASSQPYNSNLYLQSMYIGFSDHYIDTTTDTTDPYNQLCLIDADTDYLNVIGDYIQSLSYFDDTFLIQIPTWNDYTEGTMIEPHIPTTGCVHGCSLNTEENPYYYLLQIHKQFVNPSINEAYFKQNLAAITNIYFPHLFGKYVDLYINLYPNKILIQNTVTNNCITYDGSGYVGFWYDTVCDTSFVDQQWRLHAVNNAYFGWFRILSSNYNHCIVNRAHGNYKSYVSRPDGWTFSVTASINNNYIDQFWSIYNYDDESGEFMLRSYRAQKCMYQNIGRFGIAACNTNYNDQKWRFIVINN